MLHIKSIPLHSFVIGIKGSLNLPTAAETLVTIQRAARQSSPILLDIMLRCGDMKQALILFQYLRALPQPVVNGVTSIDCDSIATLVLMGCRLRVCSSSTTFRLKAPLSIVHPDVRRGYIDAFTSVLGFDPAATIALLERREVLSAEEAKELGIVTQILPPVVFQEVDDRAPRARSA